MKDILEFLGLCLCGLIIAVFVYPFAVIKAFITGKHNSELETIGYGVLVSGCFKANVGLLMIYTSVLLLPIVTK